MSETIERDPQRRAPATLLEEPGPPRPTLPERPPAPRRTARLFVLAGVLFTLVIVLGSALVYVLFLRYVPTARLHVPGNANFAARFEAADLALFGPVRKQLLPLLDTPSSPSLAPGAPTKTRVERMKDATGVDVRTDLREILVASVDATNWVALLGGRIPRGRFVRGMEQLFREDGVSAHLEGDLLVTATGVFAQADDGTIVLATNTSMAVAALPASEEWQRLGLPDHGAVTFAVMGAAFSGISSMVSFLPHGAVLGHIAHASGTLELGLHPTLDVHFEPVASISATALGDELGSVVSDLKLVTFLLPDRYGEKTALTALAMVPATDAVTAHVDWPYDGLDRAVADIARLIHFAAAP